MASSTVSGWLPPPPSFKQANKKNPNLFHYFGPVRGTRPFPVSLRQGRLLFLRTSHMLMRAFIGCLRKPSGGSGQSQEACREPPPTLPLPGRRSLDHGCMCFLGWCQWPQPQCFTDPNGSDAGSPAQAPGLHSRAAGAASSWRLQGRSPLLVFAAPPRRHACSPWLAPPRPPPLAGPALRLPLPVPRPQAPITYSCSPLWPPRLCADMDPRGGTGHTCVIRGRFPLKVWNRPPFCRIRRHIHRSRD